MLAKNKKRYEQVGVTKITKNRNLVISQCSNGGFTLAQQLYVDEGGKMTKVFLKGAAFIDSLDNLRGVEKMIRDVVKSIDEQQGVNWDDVDVLDDFTEDADEEA